MIKKNSLFITTICYLLSVVCFSGCFGYTTQSFLNPEHKSIYIKPVINNMKFTGETQEYSKFRSMPPLLENSFTQALISRFNLDGSLKIVKEPDADLILECQINDFLRSTLRYDDQDRVEEYRLKIYFDYKLYDRGANLIRQGDMVADAEFAFVGSAARSEARAISELLDDASRRISEDITEVW